MNTLRFVAISDTHLEHDGPPIPDGDVLIHAGDLTPRGSLKEIARAAEWLRSLPHARKVVIAGNHDFAFERDPERARALMHGLDYIEDREITIGGVRIWGSPWQPWFYDWAFNLARGPAIAAKWRRIPEGVDILVTHGPPFEILDRVLRGEAVGCVDLSAAIRRVRPRFHVFGHIHEGYGKIEADGVTYLNASYCDVGYAPVNPPLVFECAPR